VPEPEQPDPTDAAVPATREERTALATRSGPGRALVAVYAVFAIGATARSVEQIATRFGNAPVAFLLSGFAAVVYCVATYCLARASSTNRRIAGVSLVVETVGVLVVGTLSLTAPELFPEATVWSDYGQGYLYIPVVLPVLGLLWLRRTGRTT
jgi:hypothetical protein